MLAQEEDQVSASARSTLTSLLLAPEGSRATRATEFRAPEQSPLPPTALLLARGFGTRADASSGRCTQLLLGGPVDAAAALADAPLSVSLPATR
jgi:hypothetical protein